MKDTSLPRGSRFAFIDAFRGLVGVMMALGHSNYYFNSAWLSLDPIDPFFDNTPQFLLRYMGYLCAPGFLMMNGAMCHYVFHRRLRAGEGIGSVRWGFVQRGLFLVAVQAVWVNASWGAFERLRLDHLGIIATIGLSMILVAGMATWRWQARAAVAAALFVVHPFLLRIPYDHDTSAHYWMQLLVDSGDFTKYPLIPWLALALVGSVMAHFWFEAWTDPDQRARRSIGVGLALVAAAYAVRLGHGFGNIFAWDTFFSYSFFLVQKYPPSLAHQLWFSGTVIALVGVFSWLAPRTGLLRPLAAVGRVPLFFYCVHIPLLAFAARRLGLFYHESAVLGSLLGWVILLAVMAPLVVWFGGVKKRNRSWLIRMI
jgi:uncharacterized membrane protein